MKLPPTLMLRLKWWNHPSHAPVAARPVGKAVAAHLAVSHRNHRAGWQMAHPRGTAAMMALHAGNAAISATQQTHVQVGAHGYPRGAANALLQLFLNCDPAQRAWTLKRLACDEKPTMPQWIPMKLALVLGGGTLVDRPLLAALLRQGCH